MRRLSLILTLSVFLSSPLFSSEKRILTESNNHFALKFFYEISDVSSPENIVYSPLGISSLFNMVGYGAEGQTRTQILEALDMPYSFIWNSSPDYFGTDYGSFLNSLSSKEGSLNLANAIVLTGNETCNLQYKEFVEKVFGAQVFSGGLEAVNSWVSEKTKGKIPSILDSLNPNSVAVLLNAVYFKSDWKYAFDPKNTQDLPFSVADTRSLNTPTMVKKASYVFLEDKSFTALLLPYANQKFGMVIVEPKAGLEDFFRSAGNQRFDLLVDRLKQQKPIEATLFLPKFKLETSLDLINPFKSLGVTDAFCARADFGKSFDGAYITQAKHKTFIQVDEVGTEAAAVTAVEMSKRSVSLEREPPKEIRIDSPFYFFVIDIQSGAIIVMGSFKTPSE